MSLKSIIVDADLHSRFKLLCKGKNLKLGAVMEDLMLLYLHNTKQTQELMDEVKKQHKPQ